MRPFPALASQGIVQIPNGFPHTSLVAASMAQTSVSPVLQATPSPNANAIIQHKQQKYKVIQVVVPARIANQVLTSNKKYQLLPAPVEASSTTAASSMISPSAANNFPVNNTQGIMQYSMKQPLVPQQPASPAVFGKLPPGSPFQMVQTMMPTVQPQAYSVPPQGTILLPVYTM